MVLLQCYRQMLHQSMQSMGTAHSLVQRRPADCFRCLRGPHAALICLISGSWLAQVTQALCSFLFVQDTSASNAPQVSQCVCIALNPVESPGWTCGCNSLLRQRFGCNSCTAHVVHVHLLRSLVAECVGRFCLCCDVVEACQSAVPSAAMLHTPEHVHQWLL